MNRNKAGTPSCNRVHFPGMRARLRKFLILPFHMAWLLCCLSGCAPGRFVDGVRYAAERNGVSDASTSIVKGKGYLEFDSNMRADLDEILNGRIVESTQEQATSLLRGANELANRQASGEIERMPQKGIQWIARRYGAAENGPDHGAFREELKKRFEVEGGRELASDLTHVGDDRQTLHLLSDIRRHLRAPPGDRGRAARALIAAPFFVPAAIGAEIADSEATQRIMVADFKETVEYHFASASAEESVDDLSSKSLADLAAHFAPDFIQQVRPNASYDPNEDRIGRISLSGTPDDIHVKVDTSQPTVYWAHSQARIESRRYDQLIYTAWYPSRPPMSSGDVQAGTIDGVVIRITLDRNHRPAVYEFVRSCGCYHTLWVAEFVEAAAREEFGTPTDDGTFAVQANTKSRSLFLPALVQDDGTRPRRPLVYVESGYHMVASIQPCNSQTLGTNKSEPRPYALEPYESLTHLPLGTGTASMFDSNGLVHNAQRLEGLLLAPTGMLSAGQPRQLGTMKIRMDAYDHDDPRLLERNLRLPSSF